MSTSGNAPGCPSPGRPLIGTHVEGLALVLFTACGWGLAWPISKYLLTMLPPYSMRAVSGVIGCILAFVIAFSRRESMWPPRDQWRRIVLFAMLNYGLFIVFTTQSLARLKASEAVVLTYTIPIWTALLAWPVLRERPTLVKLLALVLAMAGVALLVGADTGGAAWGKIPAASLSLAAAACFSLGTVLGKRRPLRLPPTVAVAWQALFGIAFVCAFASTEHRDWAGITVGGWLGIAYIAVIPMTAAYLAWFRALRLVPASTASAAVLISPLVGVIGSGLMLGETFGTRQVIALIMTLTGVALAART